VLPTDQRFLELSQKQKDLLFVSFLEMPTDSVMRQTHIESKRLAEIDDDTATNLKNLGYTDAQLAKIRAQLQLAGVEGDVGHI